MVHTMLLASNHIPVRSLRLSQPANLFQQGMHCDVVFGSPSADCRGTGICKITGTNGFAPLNYKKECKETSAILVERPDSQGITLIFFRTQLCTKLYRHHFWKSVLSMKETCNLPVELQNKLQVPYQQMLPGNYAVVEESGYFRVDIDCAL